MTLAHLRKLYKEIAKWKDTHRFAAIAVELCDEVVRLRAIADERNSEFSDYTRMPFGEHKDKKLADVPEDYLRWWYSKQDRGIITLEYRHGPYGQRQIASMKARLYDYLKGRFNDGDKVSGDRTQD